LLISYSAVGCREAQDKVFVLYEPQTCIYSILYTQYTVYVLGQVPFGLFRPIYVIACPPPHTHLGLHVRFCM
jgi:hypothetical protein